MVAEINIPIGMFFDHLIKSSCKTPLKANSSQNAGSNAIMIKFTNKLLDEAPIKD